MRAALLAVAVTAAACGLPDDRPETLEYITETILAPSCGTATCHSAMKRQNGYVFDSVDAARSSLVGLIGPCPQRPCDASPGNSYLVTVIALEDAYGNRMPRDAPLPNADIKLIVDWIRDGAEGLALPAAAHEVLP